MTPAIGVFIFLSLSSAGLDIGIKKRPLKIAINKAVTVKELYKRKLNLIEVTPFDLSMHCQQF